MRQPLAGGAETGPARWAEKSGCRGNLHGDAAMQARVEGTHSPLRLWACCDMAGPHWSTLLCFLVRIGTGALKSFTLQKL